LSQSLGNANAQRWLAAFGGSAHRAEKRKLRDARRASVVVDDGGPDAHARTAFRWALRLFFAAFGLRVFS
jgi:hypothetical protein